MWHGGGPRFADPPPTKCWVNHISKLELMRDTLSTGSVHGRYFRGPPWRAFPPIHAAVTADPKVDTWY